MLYKIIIIIIIIIIVVVFLLSGYKDRKVRDFYVNSFHFLLISSLGMSSADSVFAAYVDLILWDGVMCVQGLIQMFRSLKTMICQFGMV